MRFWSSLVESPHFLLRLYLLFLLGLLLFYFCGWPILAYDTDLWTHLSTGRYIVSNGAIPSQTFTSFLSPPRDRIEYRWLYQTMTYLIYSGFGYAGLVWFKNLLYLSSLGFILGFVWLARRRADRLSSWIPLFLVLTYALFLIPRSQLVRPHAVSYLFIVVFLLILEFYPRAVPALPVLALLWCNLHAGYYPLMVGLCVAYLIEHLHNRLGKSSEDGRAGTLFLLSILLVVASIFGNPLGAAAVSPSLVSTPYASFYTGEVKMVAWPDLVDIVKPFVTLHPDSLLSFIFLSGCGGLVLSLRRRRTRISHLLLFAAGCLLLTWGYRYSYEFALLVLPLSAANLLVPIEESPKSVFRAAVRVAMAVIMVLIPWLFLSHSFRHPPRYPFSERGLPVGVAAFLDHLNVGGRVLNSPEVGGYLGWALYPRYRIMMDFMTPIFFTDDDMFVAVNVFRNGVLLDEMRRRYDPAFLAVPLELWEFEEVAAAYPEYVPVFFDDDAVLYMDAQQHPELASEYRLRILRPFELKRYGVGLVLTDEEEVDLLPELERVLDIHPGGLLANQLAAAFWVSRQQPEKALPYADTIIAHFPESVTGYGLRGDALLGVKRLPDAMESYMKALKRSSSPRVQTEIYMQIGFVHQGLGAVEQSYRAFKKAVDPFSPHTTYQDLYHLGSAALATGRQQEGERILAWAARKVDPSDSYWYPLLKHHLEYSPLPSPE